ncbi:hypothetical protein A3770_03p21750 [Chloropicon primus]|uniref:SWIM-type domain-containing protein n=1 Tax=Chloropicon primus TaxID=1764295 RepID=A0A5B8MGX7_9CHLO|nr:hypothetical protein A3770_03p21750 [Chloropicon primus]|eukprot:QDZ19657.1 hypothetical protein A3770_03p21750 [Chloropicon primus]
MGVGPEAGKSLPLGRATDEEMDDLLRALDQTKEMKKATRSRRLKSARDLLKKCSLVDPKVDETSSPPGSAVVSAQCQGTADASYDVQARLKREEGEAPWVSKLSCSCVYFEKGEAGFCKHTIALLIWSCENLEKRWNASAQGTGKEAKAPKEEGSTKEKEEDGCMVRRKSEKKKPPGESEKLSSEKDDGGQEKTPSEKINQIVPDEGGWFTRRRRPAKDQGGDGGSAEKAKAEASEPSSDVVDDIFDEWLGFQTSPAKKKKAPAEKKEKVVEKKEEAKEEMDDVFDAFFSQKKPESGSAAPRESLASLMLAKESESQKEPPVNVTSWKEDLPNTTGTKKRKVSFKEKALKLGFVL